MDKGNQGSRRCRAWLLDKTAAKSGAASEKCSRKQRLFAFSGALALGCEALLVRLNHLLERVSRTTLEFFEIPHGAFAGEKFDLQLNFIIIDRYKDTVDIFLHKIAVDESVHRIVAGGL